MLHKVERPQCNNQFKGILALQRRVLEFACSLASIRALTKIRVRKAFPKEGDWLCARLWDGNRKTMFQNSLLNVIKHVKADRALRLKILEAFDKDTQFHLNLGDPTFQFKYRVTLDDATKRVLRPLMEDFYTRIFATETGFADCIHGECGVFHRHAFIDAFYTANNEMDVCPACDNRRTHLRRADTDHFFPKSDYPFLSVHSLNLLPVCLDCNRLFKLGADPLEEIDHASWPLSKTFLPFHSPVIENADVKVSRPIVGTVTSDPLTGEREINIIDKHFVSSRRVENLNRILDLERRWSDKVKEYVKGTLEAIRGQARSIHRQKDPLSEGELEKQVRDELKALLSEKRDERGKLQGRVLHCSYLELAINDDGEFQELFAQFKEALDALQHSGPVTSAL